MIKVAITAAGGGVGQSIIKSLRGTDYDTLAIDPDPKAAGLYMADKGALGPKLDDPKFIDKLIAICQDGGCKYLFSGFDAELPVLSAAKNRFTDAGITPIISDPDVVELSDSKWALYEFLKSNELPYIPTARKLADVDFSGPYIIKPSRGCRSLHFYADCISNLKCVQDYWNDLESLRLEPIIQQYIDGPEYTCGSVSFDGKVLGVICMERELRNGDTYKAKVDQNPIVLGFVHDLISKIKPFGPCNVQLRLRDRVPYVLEINARCSGTTAARTLAGFNEPKIVLDYLEGKDLVPPRIEDGLEIYRYWEEMVVRPKDKIKK